MIKLVVKAENFSLFDKAECKRRVEDLEKYGGLRDTKDAIRLVFSDYSKALDNLEVEEIYNWLYSTEE